MKIAFILNRNNHIIDGQANCNNAHRFFVKGLFEHPKVLATVVPIEAGGEFDCAELKDFDVLLFHCSPFKARFINIDKVKALKIARGGDMHDINGKYIAAYRNIGVEHIFNHQTETHANRFLPDDIKYHQIIFGVTKELCISEPYLQRRKDKILLTGTLWSKHFYGLRIKCGDLNYVEYNSKFSDGYFKMLAQYRAAIAACSVTSVYKYFELPACGCLTFMEVTPENGCSELGFIDGENAIFINQDNYAIKTREFINNPDDPKWESIANSGREFVLANYENKIQVDKFISILETLL